MTPSLPDILIRPDIFFGRMKNEKESLKIPAIIVLAGSLVAAAYGYLVGTMSAKMMGGLQPGLDSVIILSAVIGAIVGVFIFWVLITAIIYGLSSVFKGQGPFTRLLEVTGYGYLPQIFGSVITLAAAAVYIPNVTVPVVTKAMLENPEELQAATKALMHDPAMMELTQITTLVGIVFLLWSANIWIFGTRHYRGISMRDAAICVGVPIVLWVLYMTYNLGAM
jgi:hypothetical protein